MPRGKVTSDPKTEVIKVRVNIETRMLLEKKSEKTKKTISDIIREAIKMSLT